MTIRHRFGFARPALGCALALLLGGYTHHVTASDVFDAPDADFKAQVRATTRLVVPGSEVEFSGRDFKPGQRVTLLRGETVLGQPNVVDAQGNFNAKITVPADAAPGRHPILVRADNPDAAMVTELKVSPSIPQSGAGRFDTTTAKLVQGLYQTAYSPKNDVLFVTAAVGRPPVRQSQLLKVDPKTLKILAQITPAKVPNHDDGRVYAIYGVGVDDVNGNVWITNTREDTVAVYRQSDLSLVKQFDVGAVPHSRDAIVDQRRGKAYVTPVTKSQLAVFDARTLEPLQPIAIKSTVEGEDFVPMSLELDEAAGKLYTVSMDTSEAAIIDLPSGTVENVLQLPNAHTASGVAYDSKRKRLLVASQGSDNLLIVDLASGKVVHDIPVGAGALNVAYDAGTDLAYVSNRGAGTVTVVDGDGKIVANLDGGTYPNHVHEDGKGNVFAVNKSLDANDPNGDRIMRLTPKRN